MNGSSPILELQELNVHFDVHAGPLDRIIGRRQNVVRAIDGIDLSIGRGEIVALVGESGSGKSTVGRVITKLTQPTRGRLVFDGQEITDIRGVAALRPYRRRVQMVFQDAYQALNPRQSVFDAVAEPLRSLRLVNGTGELTERIVEALEAAGLNPGKEFFGRFPHELSGGQRQRVVIAGALAAKPDFVVADEPVSMLDVSIRAQILQVLVDLREQKSLTLLFITHDMPLAWLIADRIAVMYLGRVVEIGSADDITFRPSHPYTKALRDATPKIRPNRDRAGVPALKGEAPSAGRVPKGCRFHPRCPMAFDRCRTEDPATIEVAPGHLSACWLSDGRRVKPN